jgi:hypothetical protein
MYCRDALRVNSRTWWTEQNRQDFVDLRKVLPGSPQFLERGDPLYKEI